MIKRFVAGMKEQQSRRYFITYLTGKMLGTVALLGVMGGVAWYFGGNASAQAAETPMAQAADLINPLNTVWVLVAAFLVFFMQAGFMMLEAGFARTRETVNVLMECIVDTAMCGILFWAVGFAFMFGNGNGWIGHQYFFLSDAPATYGTTGVAFLAFFVFQFAFADTASTTKFLGDLIYSVGVSAIIYPIVGHWIWGPGGWLATLDTPFRDFAGSTVVHTVGGVLALTGAIALGPRIGRKFKRDGGSFMVGHDMTIAAVGGIILWFGWYGFNPGSTLSAMDFEGIGRVAANTTLAACAGCLVALAVMYARTKKWDPGITINGFLAGLVAITAPCYWVSPLGAIIIGGIGAIVCIIGIDLIEYIRVDDPIGAVAVHGIAGIWGTISVGLFATGDFGVPGASGADLSTGTVTGLFYGGGTSQLVAQLIGSAVVTGIVLAAGLVLMYAVKAMRQLRVPADMELEGLDIHEHGGSAYHPEFAYMGGGSMVATGPTSES
jgi:Amt family ammonium transporter